MDSITHLHIKQYGNGLQKTERKHRGQQRAVAAIIPWSAVRARPTGMPCPTHCSDTRYTQIQHPRRRGGRNTPRGNRPRPAAAPRRGFCAVMVGGGRSPIASQSCSGKTCTDTAARPASFHSRTESRGERRCWLGITAAAPHSHGDTVADRHARSIASRYPR